MLSGVGDGVDGVDTPQTVMTTRAPAVLINAPYGAYLLLNVEVDANLKIDAVLKIDASCYYV